MQTITIAIGKSGIRFFARQFLAAYILNQLKNLPAPSRNNITVPDFRYSDVPLSTTEVTNYALQLTQGQILNYAPDYTDDVDQDQVNGVAVFTLQFPSDAFAAAYDWSETYQWATQGVSGGRPYSQSGNGNFDGNYAPEFSGLLVTVTVQFSYNASAGAWQISVQSTSGQATVLNTNLPSGSVLNYQSQSCSGHHFDQTTALAIAAINFGPSLNALIQGVLESIPASGQLGNGMVYNFSLGDSGLLFPNNDGIQIGVNGGFSYQGAAYPGAAPAPLSLPPVPADDDPHHLQVYVSGYAVNALNWAFYQAGKLNLVVNPEDLAHPDELSVKLYVDDGNIEALKPYRPWEMQAQVTLRAAPVTTFQTVYEFNETVMDALYRQFPDFRDQLGNLQGNNYLDLDSLENDMNGNAIPPADYAAIEAAARCMGMVVSHDLNFTLVIQDETLAPADYPNIVFHVTRTDILTGLCLGIGPNQAQTLQFQFSNYTYEGQFVSTTVPGLDSTRFPDLWGEVCEPFYDQHLQTLGTNGVPLPIMQDFQFDFTNAVLSVQDNYVSILANVLYKNS